MSTFKIEGVKWIDWLIPELNWKELDLPEYQEVFDNLNNIDLLDTNVVNYLKTKKFKVGFHKQYNSGGGWTFLKNITLTPGDDPKDPYVLSLIIHEAFHLTQSLWMRLSMQGELKAWKYQKQIYPQIARTKGNEIGSPNEAYGGTKQHWDKLADLSLDSRESLRIAQSVMKDIARGYRSDRLPLYPLPKEILFYLKQWKIKEAVHAVTNLIRGNS